MYLKGSQVENANLFRTSVPDVYFNLSTGEVQHCAANEALFCLINIYSNNSRIYSLTRIIPPLPTLARNISWCARSTLM